ncbi:class F sortase [Bacillus salacetis]|uniref:Class F sortase n=1 Tax=Bacillus salacetis TaxID=2315464 RepID=A0A3A1R717_9BACI|nr:class F sortase [Bacillus salacetis]RIW38787.1 class F sortase [Bacillus salacetis]
MKAWLKKSIILYWILLVTTISANTSAATSDSMILPSPVEESTVAEIAGTNLNYNPTQTHTINKAEVIPEKIIIPSIEMEAPVAKVGYLENGEMEVPDNIHEAGWFEPGIKPGGSGNAVIAGHLDGRGEPGAFYHIRELKKGDTVEIQGENGKRLIFEVIGIASYFTGDAPLESIFGYHANPRLNLITCSGNFNDEEQEYEERLVVYTELAGME